jgi:uncharacterized protein
MQKPPDFEQAKAYALRRLANELSPALTYHNLGHTRDEVVPVVECLAAAEQVGAEDQRLLLIGAYFHDLGFIRQRQEHELASIQIAEEVLPGCGFSETQVAVIRSIIQSTIFPQNPATLLEKIMADADLDTLGKHDFWQRSLDLRQELQNYGVPFSDAAWYTNQMTLLETHQYFTGSQRALRDPSKHQHLLEARLRLAQCGG